MPCTVVFQILCPVFVHASHETLNTNITNMENSVTVGSFLYHGFKQAVVVASRWARAQDGFDLIPLAGKSLSLVSAWFEEADGGAIVCLR